MKKTNKTISSKKGFVAEPLIDFYAFVVFILVVLIFFVIFSLMKGCDGTPSLDDVPHQKSDVDSNYVLTTWLRKPVFPQSQTSTINLVMNVDGEVDKFADGNKTKKLNFTTQKEYTIKITLPFNTTATQATLDISSNTGSNIAVLLGGADKITLYLNEYNIFPEEISNFSALRSDHDVFFVGCTDNYFKLSKDPDINLILNWLNKSNKLLFTTDYAIELLMAMFPDKYIYTNHTDIPYQYLPHKIKFTQKGTNKFKLPEANISGIWWWDKIVQGYENQVNILAEWETLPSKDYGHPIYSFKYNQSEIIHFTAHLEMSRNSLGIDFINKSFNITESPPVEKPSLDFKDDGIIEWNHSGEYNSQTTIDFLTLLNDYTKNNCTSFPCTLNLKVKADNGTLVLKNLKIIYGEYKEEELPIEDSNDMNIADLIAFSQTDEELEELRDENINTFFNNAYHDWWHLTINYPDGTTEKYGHSYTADVMPLTILAGTMALALPPGLNYVHAYLILPESEKIKINQSIPSLDKDPINIEFSKWVIVYFPHIPFI
ncbi:hypothetical protein H8D83_00565 [Candidatus Woesearchaeota archaeon]|nr:hypothetical protein [Candidatus Woesearchaeota archaeon]MBL7050823.1 hypothetical protein [Candidatus Woesearchaeota archaeon]